MCMQVHKCIFACVCPFLYICVGMYAFAKIFVYVCV